MSDEEIAALRKHIEELEAKAKVRSRGFKSRVSEGLGGSGHFHVRAEFCRGS